MNLQWAAEREIRVYWVCWIGRLFGSRRREGREVPAAIASGGLAGNVHWVRLQAARSLHKHKTFEIQSAWLSSK